jgi:polysaccharide biosynthesis protein PelG
MLHVIYRAYGTTAAPSFEFLRYFRRHADLAWCGLVYNLGIWADKPLHWWLSPHGYQVAGALHASPLYDQAVFLSFLSVAPGMAVFLLTLETTFAGRYAEFFRLVVEKGTWAEITRTKAEMVEALREGLSRLLKFQGAVTLALILGAEKLLQALGLGAVQTLVFQVTLLGVCLLVLFLALLTVLFYLDRLREALVCCGVFAAVNGALTLAGLLADERWYGVGFTAAGGAAVVVAGWCANRALQQLEYRTFTTQPIYS